MIDLTKCKKYADMIDDVVIETNNLINNYNDAAYYIGKNTSQNSTSFRENFVNEEKKLSDIKRDLENIALIIRRKAQEIYNEELQEQKRKEAEASGQNY